MKIEIVGAENWVHRAFEACGNFQWARELLKNSLQAEATRVEFGIEWHAVERHGVYRRTVLDDGCGMDSSELVNFFLKLGEGAKPIGSIHDNFGIGAKIASLPWNPDGLVVVSYKAAKASMIWIHLDGDSGEYHAREFVDQDGGHSTCVIDPTEWDWGENDVDWSDLRPEWITDHGTIVVMLGNEQAPHTVLGNPEAGEDAIKGLSLYLNKRFWDLTNVDVTVAELRGSDKRRWPKGPNDRDDSRRPNNRRIRGAQFYLSEIKSKKGSLKASDMLILDRDRVAAEWYLWGGRRPDIHMFAMEKGFIAVRYDGELHELTSRKDHFRWFGVLENAVQRNLTIVLEPQPFRPENDRWGVHPDQSRNRMNFTGDGEKGVALPLSEWGNEFAVNLPEPIRFAIREARGDIDASFDDEEYRKRLQDKFGNRWTHSLFVKANRNDKKQRSEMTEDVDSNAEVYDVAGNNNGPDGPKPPDPGPTPRRPQRRQMVVRKKVHGGHGAACVERDAPVDVPRIAFAHKEDFDHPWHLASWHPRDPEGPTVCINTESPILEEIVQHHIQSYPAIYEEDVRRIVTAVFGEVAACKVAHLQKLTREIPEEELDKTYRNEVALTTGLMGLLAEESVISHRLKILGKKKTNLPEASRRVAK